MGPFGLSGRHMSGALVAVGMIAAVSVAAANAVVPVRRGAARPAAQVGGRVALLRGASPVTSLWSRYARTWRRADGTMVTRVFRQPVNFREASGRWRAIDDRFVADRRGWHTAADRYHAQVPASLSAPVRVSAAGEWVSLRLRGARGTGSVSGVTARYPGALHGVSVTYRGDGTGLAESLVVSSAQAPARYVYDLRLSRGLRFVRRAGGRVVATAAGGRRVLALSPSVMFPSGAPQSARPVAERLSREPGGWRLVVTANRQLLRRELAAGRSVVIDPSVELFPDAQHCTIEDDMPDGNFCSLSDVEVGYTSVAPAHDHRALIKFDLSSIASDAVILNADLSISVGLHSTTKPVAVGVYRLLRDWTTDATWNHYDATHAWDTPGATGAADSSSAAAAIQTIGTTTGFVDWYPTQLVQDWVDGDVPNQGLLLREVARARSTTTFTCRLQATRRSSTSCGRRGPGRWGPTRSPRRR